MVLTAAAAAAIVSFRFGRKFLLIQGGIQLTICEIIVGILIAVSLGSTGAPPLHWASTQPAAAGSVLPHAVLPRFVLPARPSEGTQQRAVCMLSALAR